MLYGMDYLFGAAYQKQILNSHPKGWAAGFFYGMYRGRDGKLATFDPPFAVMQALIKRGGSNHFRIQVLWDDNHKFYPSDLHLIKKAVFDCEEFAKKHRSATIEISPYCEHNLKAPDSVLSEIANMAPNCRIVNTPWQGALSKQFKNEVHGGHSAPSRGVYNYSFDGTSAVDANSWEMQKTHSKSDVFYFWVPQFNRKKNTADSTPREKRQVVPNKALIESLVALTEERGKPSLPKGWLYKSHADQHNDGPPKGRDCKPVMLVGREVQNLVLKSKLGKVMAKFSPSGELDGQKVFRCPEWGYQISDKVLDVVANGKVVGQVNPAFRWGSFRE